MWLSQGLVLKCIYGATPSANPIKIENIFKKLNLKKKKNLIFFLI